MEMKAVNEHDCMNRHQLHNYNLASALNSFTSVPLWASVWSFEVNIVETTKENRPDSAVVGAWARAVLTVINEEWLSCSPLLRGKWALQCQRNIPAPKPCLEPSIQLNSPLRDVGGGGGEIGGPGWSSRRRRRKREGVKQQGARLIPSDLAIHPELVWEQITSVPNVWYIDQYR